jgi:hypothetical protein
MKILVGHISPDFSYIPLFGLNIPFSKLFSNILNVCSTFWLRDQFSYSYETTGKIAVFSYFSLYIFRQEKAIKSFLS